MSMLSQQIEAVRSATLAHLKTEVKTEFQLLREQLEPEEQTILVLRVDRQMTWPQLAEVMADGDSIADEATRKSEAARLRKRFQSIKDKLRKLAKAEGVIPGGG